MRLELRDVRRADFTVSIHVMQQETEARLVLILLKHPILHNLHVLVQHKLIGKVEHHDDDVCHALVVPLAEVPHQVLLLAALLLKF